MTEIADKRDQRDPAQVGAAILSMKGNEPAHEKADRVLGVSSNGRVPRWKKIDGLVKR